MTSDYQESKRPRTIRQYVLETVRAEILTGRMPGGRRLRQEEIAERLGVSTTPVREAIRDLVTEGLIDFDPHRGAVVRRLALADARDIFELRMVLEPLLIKRAQSPLDGARIECAHAVHKRLCAVSDIHEWSRLEQEFHSVLWTPLAGSRLANVLEGLRAAAMPYITMSCIGNTAIIEQGNKVHGQIIHHLGAGDLASAARSNHSHLVATLSVIEHAMCGEASQP